VLNGTGGAGPHAASGCLATTSETAALVRTKASTGARRNPTNFGVLPDTAPEGDDSGDYPAISGLSGLDSITMKVEGHIPNGNQQ
jgi:hypothetical protein